MSTSPFRTAQRKRIAGLLLALAGMIAPWPGASAEEALGRLFFTPERRQILDRQRQLNIQEKNEIPDDPTLTINGIVSRSSGKRTVWINGVAQNERDTQSGITVTHNPKEPGKLILQAEESPAGKARVGDTVNRNTGESTDLLKGGSIKRKQSPSTSDK